MSFDDKILIQKTLIFHKKKVLGKKVLFLQIN